MRRVLGLLALLLLPASAQATTYYVATNGSNSNSCAQATSTSTPKLTINAGIQCLIDAGSGGAGHTLLIRAGTYDEGITNPTIAGTSWDNKVRIAAYPAETVWMTPLVSGTGNNGYAINFYGQQAYVEFDGINIDGSNLQYGGISTQVLAGTPGPHHNRFQNAELIGRSGASGWGWSGNIALGSHTSGSGNLGSNEVLNMTIHGGGKSGGCGIQCMQYGIYLAGPNNLASGNNIYDTGGTGITIFNSPGDPATGNVVRNNLIHDITRSGDTRYNGIQVADSSNYIYNNVIWDVDATFALGNGGIRVSSSGSGNKLWNNTIYGNSSGDGIVVDTGTNTEITNNITYSNGGTSIRIISGTGNTQTTNLATDPTFTNAAADDFTLQVTSAAIDTGTTVATVTTDENGLARPQQVGYDIGAYEYEETPDPNNPPTMALLTPTTNTTYNSMEATVTLTGTAADDGSIASCTWANVQGLTSGSCTGTTSWSTGAVTLVSGLNEITVTVVDDSGQPPVTPITLSVTKSTVTGVYRLRIRQ